MPAIKQQEQDAGERDHTRELELLIAAFVLWYGSMLKAVQTITLRVLGFAPAPLDNASIAQAVLEAKAAAVAVDATSRRLIAERIAEGVRQGLTARQIAYGTDDFPGIHGLFNETWRNRPLTVARTELQRAMLTATVQQWQKNARGTIDGWLASDGDFDAACAARNGQVFPANAPPQLNHPNCRLTITPILR